MQHIQTALEKARLQFGSTGGWDIRKAAPTAAPAAPTPTASATGAADACWDRLRPFNPDPEALAAHKIVAAGGEHAACAQFAILRTTVLKKLRQNGWRTLAITSPSPGCGKTSVALNLAFSLAHQKDCRTILLDLDLRKPRVAKMLDLERAPEIELFLNGQVDEEHAFVRCGGNLAIAANSQPVKFAAELLQSPQAALALKQALMRFKPDVVLLDLPPMLSSDDVMAVLPNVDAAVLVVAAGATTFREADLCEHTLAEQTNVLGTVLNKCRHQTERYGY